MTYQVHIIGGGLAGSECAWQLAQRGFKVRLSEMRGGGDTTAAHNGDGLAELVCSNSFRSDDADSNAVGLLHQEMRALDSLVMQAAEVAKVPAGSALAVDRDVFSETVTQMLLANGNVEIIRERIDVLPSEGLTIIATGPLTAPGLAQQILAATGEDSLAFFDAIAPIVYHDSIDMETAWYASRWDKGDGKDYINCPMDEAQYAAFHAGLIAAEKAEFKEWEANTPYFEGCMPIEVMAERGLDTLRFGPDEAGGARQSENRALAACSGAVAARQQARQHLEHRRLSNEDETRGAGCIISDDTRFGKGRICPTGRVAPQHLHSISDLAR